MKTTIITSLFIGLSWIGLAQTNNQIKKETKQIIDSTYKALMEKYTVAGTSIAIVDNGKIVYSQGYGFSDRENGIKADDQTIYRIGSCTKSFTALSVMKLQEEGKLDVKNSIQQYISELSMTERFEGGNPLIIKDILTHTSGLPGDVLNGSFCDNPPSTDWTIKELNKQTFAAPPAYQLAYSNVGYELLGELISRLSGKSYSQYLKENVFNQLNMNSTYVIGETPVGYVDNKRMIETQIRDQSAGLIHSNAVDMAQYLMMYLNKGNVVGGNKLVSSESVKEMEKNQIANVLFNNRSQWGYGLYKKDLKVEDNKDTLLAELIGHGGDTWAFHADFKYIPELNVGAIILTNSDKGNRIASATRLLKLYLKNEKNKTLNFKVPKPKSSIVETLPTKEEMKGFYSFGPYSFTLDNPKKIKIKMGIGRVVLTPVNDSLLYTGKINLLGFIPLKLKQQQFKFVKIKEEVFFKNIDIRSNYEFFESKRVIQQPIPEEWMAAKGKYIAINDFSCVDCPSELEKSKLKISEKNGTLFFELETNSLVKGTCYLDILDKELAVTNGMGRGTGDTVRILENGNLYFNGYEFAKK